MKKELQLNESLAALGHGKWKRALGCTLLMIGLLMGGMNAWGQAPENGLYMHKTWEPDYATCPDGSCGQIRLETFVTGESMTVNTHVPTDIVLVLDRSGSMNEDFGSTSRIAALIEGVQTFLEIILQDAAQYNCDHRVAGVGFSTINTTAIVTTGSEVRYGTNSGNTLNPNTITTANADEALRLVNTGTQESPVLNTYLGSFFTDRIETLQSGGTHPECGLSLAYDILDKRTVKTYNAGTEEEPNMVPRSQVVVFFTDGAPGNTSTPRYFYNTESLTSTQNQAYIADLAVAEANDIKDLGATIFSVGVITGADENAAYKSSASYGSGTNISYYTTVTQCTNGFLHFVSSNYGSTTNGVATSFRGLTTSDDNTANKFPDSKYIVADEPEELNAIFTNIAQQSGGAAIEMGTSTVVQDVVTADFNFNIPVGSNIDQTIKAYMPKCTGYVDANGNDKYDSGEVLVFDNLQEGALTIGDDGIAIGNENKLPDGTVIVDVDTKTLTLTNIDFDNMWCGPELGSSQEITGWHGRKLVILIPLVIAGNTWGDGIVTNTPMSIILPNGDELHPLEFNIPVADVLGEVWTEVVTDKPGTFDATADPIPLTTPEDLAWFISYVNGRAGYEDNPDVEPNPTANAILMADIDMSAHNWVPIGTNQPDGTIVSYQGTFDGNGHVITGLKNNAGKQFLNGQISWVFPGMFNKVGNGGVVKNVFVLDADFRGQQRTIGEGATAKDVFVHHGIIADTLLSGGNIFNCEAAGRISCKSNEANTNLIFGGLVGLNLGTVHSCMAMAELTGYTMGGMIGENRGGSFSNGFTNGVYNFLDDNAENISVGGLAGINTGNISNCYVRFERENTNLENVDNFGQLVGYGSGNVSLCYTPENFSTIPETPAGTTYTTYTNTTHASRIRQDRSNDNMVGGTWIMDNTILNGGTPLLTLLNANKGAGASWKRTTAGGFESGSGNVCGNINGDYPILKFTDYTCVASADGIRLDYAATLDEMLDRHNLGNMNVETNMPSTDDWYTTPDMPVSTYAVTQSPAIYGGAINLYANDNTTKSTSTTAKTVVYIDENVSLLQDANSSIDAYTGQTIKDFGSDYNTDGNRWHNVSSSLQNSKFGWTYWDDQTQTDYTNIIVPHNWDSNPCYIWLETSKDDEAIFPTDTRSPNAIDFYCFYEPQYHWINFKRNSKSHWHMDNYEINIPYTNEDHFIPGKGYLMALYTEYFANHHIWNGDGKNGTFLQNRGTLNNGNVDIPVTYTKDAIIDLDGYKTHLEGYNLLGNPYQSYLDFDKFVEENSDLMANSKFANTYAVYDPNNDKYIQYQKGSSVGSETASRYINMHQGFFIQVNAEGTAAFTNDMRTNTTDTQTGFRGEQPAYPLINFTVTDYEGETDLAVLELNRPENDGAKKLRMGSPAGRIYFRYDNTNLAIYFRNSDKDYQTLNFSAEEDGNFTLSWNMANADFSSLTLVDNITGIKTDMLTHDHYTFEGRMDDYNTRFKIMFGEMNNNEEEPVLEHFAFFDHGNLIVNGTGHFEVVDVMGRVLYAVELTDTQNTVSLPSNVRGVCMLCFTRNNETKVQKMVIQ